MSTGGFILYDDAQARQAEPFALTRPFGELRAGGALMRQRWERVAGVRAAGFIGAPHLGAFQEFDSPAAATSVLKKGTIVVNSRFAPALDATMPALAPGHALMSDGRAVAVALAGSTEIAALGSGAIALDSLATRDGGEIAGWWLAESWDAVRLLPVMLAADASVLADAMARAQAAEPPAHVAVLGEHRLAAARGSHFEPYVVVDTTGGDVVVEDGARIAAFTRIAGPCVIGERTQVAGGRITCCSIGAQSRICGEMSVAIVFGHTNKTHDGFVGHSMIGRWVNVGAGTITSNLKNSYGSVWVSTARGMRDTGMQFLGALIGDHAKLATGTRLTTGSIVGAGANVFGDQAPDQHVPAFAWGGRPPFAEYDLDKFLAVAAHVMERRDVTLTGGMRETLAAAWKSVRGKTPARPKGGPKSRQHL